MSAETLSLENLKTSLMEALQQQPIDYDQVVRLSAQLARQDPDHVRFSIDAAHISRLGRELVAREETAVSELVKNAYDADATRVELRFQDAYVSGGSLVIEDDGVGMDRQQLLDGFMRLASQEKVRHPFSPLFHRQRAGRKGIGRFAAQRLGSHLTILTQTKESDTALKVTIDWNLFQGDTDLSTISSRLEVVEKQREQGTTLIIDDLAEDWSQAKIERIYRHLADLLQPFPLSQRQADSHDDPGFEIAMSYVIDNRATTIADTETMIYSYALAEIEAWVDEAGQGHWSLKSSQLGLDERKQLIGKKRDENTLPFDTLRSVHLKAYYYIYNAGYIPHKQNATIRDLAKQQGGIRLYRNGFRVLPYGEPFNDWLSLDASVRQRVLLVPHGNNNFFGFVEVHDTEGTQFEETSSREGLLQNQSFRELVDFAYRALQSAVIRIANARDRKALTSQPGLKIEEPGATDRVASEVERLTNAIQSFATVYTQSAEANEAGKQALQGVQANLQLLQKTARQAQSEKDALLAESGMLRILASLGLAIGEFTHEVNNLLPAMESDVHVLLNRSLSEKERKDTQERLCNHLASLKTYLSYFVEATQDNVHREMRPQELEGVARNFWRLITSSALRYGVEIREPEAKGYDLFTCPMHRSEWASILFNFFTNSLKAIRRAGTQGRILIRVGRVGSKVYLDFADNGDGIPEANQERIFEPFFTTTSAASPYATEQDEVRGMGLGLAIVQKIVMGYQGEVTLTSPPPGYTTCFRVMLPQATEEEESRYDR